jgi:lipid-A-disaccharide synthase
VSFWLFFMPKLFFSAGDLSGDYHCSLLARELTRRHPEWQLHALGGRHLRESGAQMVGDTSELGVIGFASALAILPQTLKLRARTLKWLESNQPDLAILCDWGGFNSRMLAEYKRLEIPVLYYFPPRSWQKHGNGGLSVGPFCERIATPFEWSADRLKAAGSHAEWVGHPILETARAGRSRQDIRDEFNVKGNTKFIALLAGSRALERKIIAPHVAGAVKLLQKQFDARFFVAATSGTGEKLRAIFPPEVQIIENRTFDLLKACDAAIVKSGTSTLEAAVADAPQVVVYDVPALLRMQVHLTGLRRKVPFVAMPNIILERAAAPELLGNDCRAPKIAAALTELLESAQRRDRMRQDYSLVREALGEKLPYTATGRTADMVEELVPIAS